MITIILFAVIPAIAGAVLAKYVSGPLLGLQHDWPISILVSAVPLLCCGATVTAFSYKAPDSTFFTLLPFLIYFIAAAALVKLFVKKEAGVPSGISEALFMAFIQTAATLLIMLVITVAVLFIFMAFANK